MTNFIVENVCLDHASHPLTSTTSLTEIFKTIEFCVTLRPCRGTQLYTIRANVTDFRLLPASNTVLITGEVFAIDGGRYLRKAIGLNRYFVLTVDFREKTKKILFFS